MVDLHDIRARRLVLVGPDGGDVHIVIEPLHSGQNGIPGHHAFPGFVFDLKNGAAVILRENLRSRAIQRLTLVESLR